MKNVWKYNAYERPMGFWDYYDLLDDCGGLVKAMNLAKKEELIEDEDSFIALNLICADMYECYEHDKKYQIKKINPIIRILGGYTELGGRKERLINYCLSYLKKELHSKDFSKLQNWLRSETQNA